MAYYTSPSPSSTSQHAALLAERLGKLRDDAEFAERMREAIDSATRNIFDHFHITTNIHKTIDEVRAKEARELTRQGKDVLNHR